MNHSEESKPPDRIRTVVFDYGNVVSLPQRPTEVEHMAAICGLPVDRFHERYWQLRLAYDRGELDGPAYWKSVTDGQGTPLTREQITCVLAVDGESWSHPNEKTLGWARQLKHEGFGLSILSNMPFAVSDYLEKHCEWLAIFDHRIYSYAVRHAKPEIPIYMACLDLLKLAPEQILFLDDRPENVKAASELGIHSLLFDTLEQAAARAVSQFGLHLSFSG
jgi:putative hydrolase of the HAD superfamily